MTFEEALARRAELEKEVSAASEAMMQFPRDAWGLTPDATKATAAYKVAKAKWNIAFDALRFHNGYINRQFKAENREHYRRKREEKGFAR